MVLSAVPPPEAKRPCWWGDQAIAFTAAVCSLNLMMGCVEWAFQIKSLLSFPPEHNCCSSGDHFKPQISCLWPVSFDMNGWLTLKSRWRIVLSLEPELKILEFQAIAPILLEWPCIVLYFFILTVSQICTSPLFVPIPSIGPLRVHETAVTESLMPRSHNFDTLDVAALHR